MMAFVGPVIELLNVKAEDKKEENHCCSCGCECHRHTNPVKTVTVPNVSDHRKVGEVSPISDLCGEKTGDMSHQEIPSKTTCADSITLDNIYKMLRFSQHRVSYEMELQRNLTNLLAIAQDGISPDIFPDLFKTAFRVLKECYDKGIDIPAMTPIPAELNAKGIGFFWTTIDGFFVYANIWHNNPDLVYLTYTNDMEGDKKDPVVEEMEIKVYEFVDTVKSFVERTDED